MQLSIRTTCSKNNSSSSNKGSSYVNWSKLSQTNINGYCATLDDALDLITVPASLLHGSLLCTEDCHKYDIELYCSQIIDAISQADSVLEKRHFHTLKPYWSPELTALKHQSYTDHKAWLEGGKPASGILYDNYLKSRSEYRQ